MAGLDAKSKPPIALIMSSREKVANSIDVACASRSAADIGMAMPPKSVRCVQSQCRKPSGPLGGATFSHPSSLHVLSSTSQNWHLTSMSHFIPRKPSAHTQSPLTHTP